MTKKNQFENSDLFGEDYLIETKCEDRANYKFEHSWLESKEIESNINQDSLDEKNKSMSFENGCIEEMQFDKVPSEIFDYNRKVSCENLDFNNGSYANSTNYGSLGDYIPEIQRGFYEGVIDDCDVFLKSEFEPRDYFAVKLTLIIKVDNYSLYFLYEKKEDTPEKIIKFLKEEFGINCNVRRTDSLYELKGTEVLIELEKEQGSKKNYIVYSIKKK